jgi:hypothetical protein
MGRVTRGTDVIIFTTHSQRDRAATRFSFAMSLSVVTCLPHRQFRGNLVAFVQFSIQPPASLRALIKRVGKGAYRQSPPGFENNGWHISQPSDLARAVQGKWPSFAQALMKVRRVIKQTPEQVQQPSKGPGEAMAGARRGGRLVPVKM